LIENIEDDTHNYLILEYCPGGDLYSIIEQKVLAEETVRFFAAEAALAIHAVHRNNYCHRDIKPDNFILDENGHVKLCDFGFCTPLNVNGKVESGGSVGTPEYIAPEVLLSNTASNPNPSLRSSNSNQNSPMERTSDSNSNNSGTSLSYGIECDWWSLGIVIYEMFFGYTPFQTPNLLRTYSIIKDHKTYFQIPETPAISNEAKDLLKKLICDSSGRLKFEEIKAHPFFTSISWDDFEKGRNGKALIMEPRIGGKPRAPPIPEPESTLKIPKKPKIPTPVFCPPPSKA